MAEGTRHSWTDERLDDLGAEVKLLRADMNRGFDRIDSRLERIDQRFELIDQRLGRVDGRIDGLHRTILVVGGGLAASILVSAAGLAATQL